MNDAFNAAVDDIREGEVMFIDDLGVNLELRFGPMSILAAMLTGDAIGMIGLAHRPGVAFLQRYLELRHFPPHTPRNKEMLVAMMRWQGMMWLVTVLARGSISETDLAGAMSVAGLRARGGVRVLDGEPAALVDGTVPAPELEFFKRGFVAPELPESVLVLENVPGHLIYSDPKRAHQIEKVKIEELKAQYEAGWPLAPFPSGAEPS